MSSLARAPRRRLPLAVVAALGLLAGLLPVASTAAFTADPATVWINEIHYDNTGADTGEAIEIAGPAGTNLSGWSIVLYNGSGGAVYDSFALSGTVTDQQGGFGTVAFARAGIQNGSPDGIALANGTTLVQFLSYEGAFTGVGGVANGVTSTDIGVFENGSGPIGDSLQLTGTGSTYQDFTWSPTAPNTFGAVNTGQTFGAGGDAAPVVASSSPADGASGVAPNATLSVTFSEEVVIATGALTLTCDGDGLSVTVPGGPATTFEITHLPLSAGASCTIAISATGVTDTDTVDPPDTMAADASIQFTVAASDPCAGPFTPIYTIQGSGSAAAVTGPVTTQGVVVGDYEGPSPTLRGFYLQDATGDANAATSDGIFVFNGNSDSVSLGDTVRVTGNAGEFQDQTQISSSAIVTCGTGASVAPVDISFPVASSTALEAVEGMLVRVPETMTVTEHFQLGRFGQVVVSSEGRLDNPTAVVDPGAPAVALQAANDLRKIIVDDPLQDQNPDPILFGRGGAPLSASNTLRGGDTVSNLTGVMTYTWAGNAASGNAFRIRPLGALGGTAVFVAANARPGPSVDIAGNVRIAGMNLLNYFNTFDGLPDTVDNCNNGVGGAATDCRGADTQAEFDRQVPKTVAAILGLDADVIGVNEIENDGYGPASSIAHLVDALNAASAPGTYAFIDVDAETGQLNALGTDAIKVGMIYRPAAVTPIGDTAALNSLAFIGGGDGVLRSRPSLAQAFETGDGARFIVDVNHFKSKGSACNTPDSGDGQGNCNLVRTNAAIELAAWLAGDPTGIDDDDVFIVGDLNSYAREDPIGVLEDAGYTNLVAEFVADPYSFVFDGQWGYLDYALGSPTALGQVAAVEEWHINADEPSVLDYNTNFKSAGQITSLYAPDRFRVSDHDPIVVGLDALSDRPDVDAGGPYLVEELGSVELHATGSDPTDDVLSYAWDLDGNGSFETSGQTVTFAAGSLQAPQTVTVTVQVTDEHGQVSTDTATIDVIWAFGGFRPPLDPTALTEVKAGSSVPVKFSLAGFQGLDVLDGMPTLQRTDCSSGADIGSPVPTTGTLTYEAIDDLYKFTWKTHKSWVGWCGTLTVALADGQASEADLTFK